MVIRSSNHSFLFIDDFNAFVKPNDMTAYGNPLMGPVLEPDKKSPNEWLVALKGEEKCLQIFFSSAIAHFRPSEKIADGSLIYVNGNGETREKTISLEERLIGCHDNVWNISH